MDEKTEAEIKSFASVHKLVLKIAMLERIQTDSVKMPFTLHQPNSQKINQNFLRKDSV